MENYGLEFVLSPYKHLYTIHTGHLRKLRVQENLKHLICSNSLISPSTRIFNPWKYIMDVVILSTPILTPSAWGGGGSVYFLLYNHVNRLFFWTQGLSIFTQSSFVFVVYTILKLYSTLSLSLSLSLSETILVYGLECQ